MVLRLRLRLMELESESESESEPERESELEIELVEVLFSDQGKSAFALTVLQLGQKILEPPREG